MLQNVSLDLAKAADLVSGTTETLEDLWTDSYWDRLFTYVERVAKLHSINIIGYRPRKENFQVVCVTQSCWSALA